MAGALRLPIIDLSASDRISSADSIRQVLLPLLLLHQSCKLYPEIVFPVLMIVCVFHTRQACIECGFFYLVNHGVEQELLAQVFDESRNFFSLPLEDKSKLARKHYRGYTTLFAENLDPDSSSTGLALFFFKFCSFG